MGRKTDLKNNDKNLVNSDSKQKIAIVNYESYHLVYPLSIISGKKGTSDNSD